MYDIESNSGNSGFSNQDHADFKCQSNNSNHLISMEYLATPLEKEEEKFNLQLSLQQQSDTLIRQQCIAITSYRYQSGISYGDKFIN
jgi:hypothetical protein